MGIFSWKRRKVIEAKAEHIEEIGSYVEVVALKNKTAENADDALREIERLNRLLRADGITLKIHIATGGGRHGH